MLLLPLGLLVANFAFAQNYSFAVAPCDIVDGSYLDPLRCATCIAMANWTYCSDNTCQPFSGCPVTERRACPKTMEPTAAATTTTTTTTTTTSGPALPTNASGQTPCFRLTNGTLIYHDQCGVCGGRNNCVAECPVESFPLCPSGVESSAEIITQAAIANIVTSSVSQACSVYTAYLQCIKANYSSCFSAVYAGGGPSHALDCTKDLYRAEYARISCSAFCDLGTNGTVSSYPNTGALSNTPHNDAPFSADDRISQSGSLPRRSSCILTATHYCCVDSKLNRPVHTCTPEHRNKCDVFARVVLRSRAPHRS